MKFKSIASLSAVLILINAILFMVFPEFSMSILGRSLSPAGIMNTRISGACALGLSLILWQLRNTSSGHTQRVISRSLLVTYILLLAIDLHGIATGAVNQVGWVIFIADILLAAGFVTSIFTGTLEN
jgi:hypothetical protein